MKKPAHEMRPPILRYSIYLTISSIPCFIFDDIAKELRYDLFKEYCNSLMVVSGMVFTLMGIWIAFLYPNSLEKIKNPSKIEVADFSDNSKDLKRLNYIVGAILKSLLIMSSILFIYAAIALLKNTYLYNSYFLGFKKLAIFSIVIMFLMQAECIISVMKSNIEFLNDIHSKRSNAIAENDF